MVINFDGIQKTYPPELGSDAHLALDTISFQIKVGETVAMIGPNGAGKSTSIKLLLDFIRPDRGSVQLFGRPAHDHNIRQRIGYLPEAMHFPENLSCMDMLRFAGRSCGMSARLISESAEPLLQRLNLWEARKRLLRTYSKGMRQRAGFATALIHDPELLILDEPMSGLDPIGRAEIVGLIQEMKDRGKSILFCSHLLNDVERLADRVLVLHKGNLLFDGSVQDMLNGHEIEEAFLQLIKGANHV
ncbi:MAG: ABC transporter ATP-binding protein [Mariprofundaceae bacterium]